MIVQSLSQNQLPCNFLCIPSLEIERSCHSGPTSLQGTCLQYKQTLGKCGWVELALYQRRGRNRAVADYVWATITYWAASLNHDNNTLNDGESQKCNLPPALPPGALPLLISGWPVHWVSDWGSATRPSSRGEPAPFLTTTDSKGVLETQCCPRSPLIYFIRKEVQAIAHTKYINNTIKPPPPTHLWTVPVSSSYGHYIISMK